MCGGVRSITFSTHSENVYFVKEKLLHTPVDALLHHGSFLMTQIIPFKMTLFLKNVSLATIHDHSQKDGEIIAISNDLVTQYSNQ